MTGTFFRHKAEAAAVLARRTSCGSQRSQRSTGQKCSSPSKGGLDKGHGPVDLGAVFEGLDVGGVDGDGVGQSAGADSITDWKKGKTLVRLFQAPSLSLSRSVSLYL